MTACPWRLRAGSLDVGCQLTNSAHFDLAEDVEHYHYHRSSEGWGVEWTRRTEGAYRIDREEASDG